MEHICINDAIYLDFRAPNFPLIFPYLNTFFNSMFLYNASYTVENNKNQKTVKFQGDVLNFCDFIQGPRLKNFFHAQLN